MPLEVAIVGAGIAGLSTAIALKRSGHRVSIFEKSKFATETGAAVAIAANGARVLESLGFSFEKARAVELLIWQTVDGCSLQPIDQQDFSESVAKYGHPMRSIHRVDLHNELLRLVTEAPGDFAVQLKLASPVASVDARSGTLHLADGSIHQADLIVGADGLRSKVREAVIEEVVTLSQGISAFRFLIPTATVQADKGLEDLLKWKVNGSTIAVDTRDPQSQRHTVWYSCRGGEVQNCVGLHPTRPDTDKETASTDFRHLVRDEFQHFHPDLLRLFSHAEDVKCWPLYSYDPFPRWSSGKAVVIGDAAHPMLPFGGQAANQALEDSGALSFFLDGVHHPDEIGEALSRFERVRRKRASMIQILSSTIVGHEADARSRIAPFAEEGFLVPSNFAERVVHAVGFDVFARCREIAQQDRRDPGKNEGIPSN